MLRAASGKVLKIVFRALLKYFWPDLEIFYMILVSNTNLQ